MEEKKPENEHRFVLTQRNHGLITGVEKVRSFNESEILLQSQEGKISIKGDKLHVCQLNLEKGEIEIDGRVDSLVYMSKSIEKERQSLLRKMFR